MTTYQSAALDALGDPTRRAIFERLADGPRVVGELARELPVSRPAVSQHLKVLKEAGLVTARQEGTRRRYQLDPAGIGALRAWLDRLWDQALEAFKAAVEQPGGGATMTTTPDTELIVRKAIMVDADQQRAFEVFTARHGAWWPASYHIDSADYQTAVIEPFAGGRWFERGVDGSECDWGRVLVWDPPHRLVLAWQISADWQFDPDLVTEVDVRFQAVGATRTRVELEHRHLDRFGARGRDMQAIFESGGQPGAPQGWAGILDQYAAVART